MASIIVGYSLDVAQPSGNIGWVRSSA
jgi:hypothetical protein